VVGPDTLFNSRIEQLAALSVRHALPTVYQWREFVAAGGLLSYESSISDAFRLGGVYAGRILKGDKPTDLHVTRAADRIGLSQPAMSNALSRLHHIFKDELLVRTANAMQATPRAIELAEPVMWLWDGV
jgi:hypothetical protein